MSDYHPSSLLNRTMCDVLREMRDQLKQLDLHNIEYYKSMTGMLIEELQSMGNRMEAKLYSYKEHKELENDYKKLYNKWKKLKMKVDGLEEQNG